VEEEQAPEVDERALRREKLQARVEELKERNQARQIKQYEAQLRAKEQELQQQAAWLQQQEQKLRGGLEGRRTAYERAVRERDAVSAMRALGFDPREAYQQLTEAALQHDTPEGQQSRMMAQIEERIAQAQEAALEEARQAREEARQAREQLEGLTKREAQMVRHSAVQKFSHILSNDPKYEGLVEVYGGDDGMADLIGRADAVANHWRSQGVQFNLADVADVLLEAFQQQEARWESYRGKRQQRQPGEATEQIRGGGRTAGALSGRAASTVASGAVRARSQEELDRAAEAEIARALGINRR
jgi:DNA repair exonuclease SbcCD ATPase subunit